MPNLYLEKHQYQIYTYRSTNTKFIPREALMPNLYLEKHQYQIYTYRSTNTKFISTEALIPNHKKQQILKYIPILKLFRFLSPTDASFY